MADSDNPDVHVKQGIDLEPPRDQETKRNWKGRLLATVITISVLVGIPTVFSGFFGWFLSNGNWSVGRLVGCIGFVIGAEFVAQFAPRRMFIYVPEWCAFVTQNAWLRSTMVAYGPGFHLSYFWEARNAKGNWWMGPVVKNFAIGILTKSGEVIAVGKYFFRINLKKIERAIGVAEEVIDGLFQLSIKGLLTRLCAKKTIDEARVSIDELNAELVSMLMRETKNNPATLVDERKVVKFGDPYGIIPVNVGLEDLNFSAKITQAFDALATAEMQAKVVASLFGIPYEELLARRKPGSPNPITDKVFLQMLDRAAVQSGAGKLNLTVFEGGSARPVVLAGGNQP